MDLYVLELISTLFLLFFAETNSIRFFLQPNVPKCLKEEIHKGIVVTGDYEFSEGPGQKATIRVSCPKKLASV